MRESDGGSNVDERNQINMLRKRKREKWRERKNERMSKTEREREK